MISALDDYVDDAVEEEDFDAAVRRRAREILARTEPTYEEREAHEERARANRVAEIIAADQQRRAPLSGEVEEQWEADLRHSVARAPSETRQSLIPRDISHWEFSKCGWKHYAWAHERALRRIFKERGDLIVQLVAELRKISTKQRKRIDELEAALKALAGVEERLAALEAKGVAELENHSQRIVSIKKQAG